MRAANDTRPAPSAQANMSHSKYLRLQRRAPGRARGKPPRRSRRGQGLESVDAVGKAHNHMTGPRGFEALPRFLQVTFRVPEPDHQGHVSRPAADAPANRPGRGDRLRR